MQSNLKTALCSALLFLTLACPSQRETQTVEASQTLFEKVNERGLLRVGYLVFPPVTTKDVNSGELGGHFISTIEEIAKQAGWKIEFVETDFSGFVDAMSARRFDIAATPTFSTIPRAKRVWFTTPLFFAGNSVVRRADDERFSDIASFDRADVTIALTQGEAGHEYVERNFSLAKTIVHPGGDQGLTFQDVLSGRADVAFGDAYVTEQFAAQHPELVDHFAGRPYDLTGVSWAVPVGETSMLQFLNTAIATLQAQGRLREFERDAGAHWVHPKVEWVSE